jgi:hypothetical protein
VNLSKLVRVVGLCLALTVTALSAFATELAPPQPCSCSYCPTVSSTTRCSTGTGNTTCGSWLAVTLCGPVG